MSPNLNNIAEAIQTAQAAVEAAGISGKIVVAVDQETFVNLSRNGQASFVSTGRTKLECVVAGVTFRV